MSANAQGIDVADSRGAPRRALGALLGVSLFGLLLLSDWAVCPFANVTGFPCPGCGMTRATIALVSGHFWEAVRMHPLSPICVPVVGLTAAEGLASFITKRNPRWTSAVFSRLRLKGDWVFGGLTAALVLVWALRFLGWFGGPVPVNSALHTELPPSSGQR